MEKKIMPDLDSLSIQIKASTTDATRKIDDLILSLSRLNAALNNYADGSDYVKGMNNLAGGLRGISSAINSIPLEKIKDTSRAITSLATAGEKLTRLNFVSTFAQMGSETQKLNSAAATTTKQIMEMFNIPKSYKGELTQAVRELYHSGGNESVFRKASTDIRELVTRSQHAKKNLSETYTAIRQYLNASKMYIPQEVMQEWGSDAKRNRAIIGVGNTTTDYSKDATSLEIMAREMKEVYGASIDMEHGITGMANSMVEFLTEEKNFAAVHTDFSMLTDLLTEVDAKINATTQAFTTMTQVAKSADDEFMVPLSDAEFEAMINGANTASVAVQNVGTAVDNLKAETSVEIANPFEGLIRGLESMQGIEIPAEKFAGVATLASSLSRFGSKTATNAITTIPQIGRAFAQMATELSKAPTISSNLVRMAEALSKYSKNAATATTQTNRLGTSTGILKGALGGLYTPTMRAHKGFTSLAAVAGTLYANFFLLIRAARLLGKAMDYSSSMTEAQNVVSVVFGKSSEVMDDFAKTAIKDFGLARLSAVQFASRFQAMGKTMGITAEQVTKANDYIAAKITGNERAYDNLGDSVADVSINLTKLTADIASLYNQDYEDVAKDMQAIYTGMTRPLRKYGLDLTNATLKEWAMSQGLDSNIEKMSQAEKTMLRYQYVMSRAGIAMGDFQKTQDTFANSLRTVKQLLQEIARLIGEALINALGPALIQFKHFLFNLVDMTQSALNAIGKLLGWKQIDFGGAALVEDTEDYADALDDAAGAAKKLKTQLRGIDELNNLTSNKGGGGGGANAASLGADLESIWDLMEETNRAYESSITSWNQFGKEIAKKIKEGLSSIDWDQIYSKAGAFGVLSASFLNGLIDPEAFNLFGKTLAGGVMTAIKTAFTFGKNFDWKNLGDAIAEGFNGFFAEFDGGELADTINIWVQGLETTFKTAVSKINWGNVFEDLYDFLKHIDIKTIGIIVGASTVITGLPAVAKLLGEQLSLNPLTLGVLTIAAVAGFKFGDWIGQQWEEALGTNPATNESYWYEFWEKVFIAAQRAFEIVNPIANAISMVMVGGVSGNGKSVAEMTADWYKDFARDWRDNSGPILAELKEEWQDWWFGLFDDLGLNRFIVKLQAWIHDIKALIKDPKRFWSMLLTEGVSDQLFTDFEAIGKSIQLAWQITLKVTKDDFDNWWNVSFKGTLNNIAQGIEKFVNGIIDGFGDLVRAKDLLTGSSSSFSLTHVSIPRFANGGYPQMGSLFWANEAGPELVGTMNGKTAVASNNEITGITAAINSASASENELLRQQNQLLQDILAKEFGISSKEVFTSVRKSAREYVNMTGSPAF